MHTEENIVRKIKYTYILTWRCVNIDKILKCLDIRLHLNVSGGDLHRHLRAGHHARAHRQPRHHALR